MQVKGSVCGGGGTEKKVLKLKLNIVSFGNEIHCIFDNINFSCCSGTPTWFAAIKTQSVTLKLIYKDKSYMWPFM